MRRPRRLSSAIGGTVEGLRLEVDARERALLTWMSGDRLKVTTGGRGRFRRPRTELRAEDLSDALVLTNLRGDAAIAWEDFSGSADNAVFAAVRKAGGRFGRPRRISGRSEEVVEGALDGAIDHRGDVLLAWLGERGSRERVRVADYRRP
jgi:hypothetical protein